MPIFYFIRITTGPSPPVAAHSGPGDAEIRIRYHGRTLAVHSYEFVEIPPMDDSEE
jgi:hypothetical protein